MSVPSVGPLCSSPIGFMTRHYLWRLRPQRGSLSSPGRGAGGCVRHNGEELLLLGSPRWVEVLVVVAAQRRSRSPARSAARNLAVGDWRSASQRWASLLWFLLCCLGSNGGQAEAGRGSRLEATNAPWREIQKASPTGARSPMARSPFFFILLHPFGYQPTLSPLTTSVTSTQTQKKSAQQALLAHQLEFNLARSRSHTSIDNRPTYTHTSYTMAFFTLA